MPGLLRLRNTSSENRRVSCIRAWVPPASLTESIIRFSEQFFNGYFATNQFCGVFIFDEAGSSDHGEEDIFPGSGYPSEYLNFITQFGGISGVNYKTGSGKFDLA